MREIEIKVVPVSLNEAKGHSWNCKSRPRNTTAPECDKIRYVKILNLEAQDD